VSCSFTYSINTFGKENHGSAMSGHNINRALEPLYLISKLLGLTPYPLEKTGTAIPDITKKSPFVFSTLHNYMMFLYMFGWFTLNMIWEAIYRYPKQSSKNIIPIVIRNCTFSGVCL